MAPRLRHIHQHWSYIGTAHRLIDGASILAGLWIASRYAHWLPSQFFLEAGVLAMIVYGAVAELCGIYRSWRGASTRREIVAALLTWGVTLLLVTMGGFFFKRLQHEQVSRLAVFIWFLATPVLMVGGRLLLRGLLRTLRAMGYNTRSFVVVGVTELGFQLVRNIEKSPEMGLEFLGFFDDRDDLRTPDVPEDLPGRIGNLDELLDQARQGRVDTIYITFPMRAEDRIRNVLERLGDTTASVYVVPDFFVFELLHSRWTDILGVPVVSVFETPFYGIDGMAKRLGDLVIGSLLLALMALPMLLIALAIKLTSAGPIFFRQRRYGLDGREIRVWKFRTMRVCEDGAVAVQATRDDPRVTPLGVFLRATSLDELPQLINVLEGTMSLVGPRPHPHALNERFRSRVGGYMLRHKVKPGITGLAQVSGWRGETDVPEKMENRIECDLRYIREWSLWLDFKILSRTFFVVLSRKNAY
ncbi:MAG: undecaprenyl-phosphate glucose phosphotransferase [Pirellulales bacterium]|nr:undecaprenyl-phosphate glucose phosphotransferase [Pirellulales bacterium]